MKITICGSLKFIEEMKHAKAMLEKKGHKVLLPLSAEINQDKNFWNEIKQSNIKKFSEMKGERMKGHNDKIKSSDAITKTERKTT